MQVVHIHSGHFIQLYKAPAEYLKLTLIYKEKVHAGKQADFRFQCTVFLFFSVELVQSKQDHWPMVSFLCSSPLVLLFSQDRHSVVKRGEGESPPSTSPDDTNQTFKFSPGDGQALQVRQSCIQQLSILSVVEVTTQSWLADSLIFSFLSLDHPSPRYSPASGPGQSQEWREAGGAVSSCPPRAVCCGHVVCSTIALSCMESVNRGYKVDDSHLASHKHFETRVFYRSKISALYFSSFLFYKKICKLRVNG